VQEEIGLRGATTSTHAVRPQVGIAVDVCHSTDTPGADKKQIGDVRLGKGPTLFRGANVNPRVFERLQAAAKTNEIGVQLRGAPRATGTDANAMQLSREGVATAVVGIPNRYMHRPVEMVSLGDLDSAARLLAAFCEGVTPDTDWTPCPSFPRSAWECPSRRSASRKRRGQGEITPDGMSPATRSVARNVPTRSVGTRGFTMESLE